MRRAARPSTMANEWRAAQRNARALGSRCSRSPLLEARMSLPHRAALSSVTVAVAQAAAPTRALHPRHQCRHGTVPPGQLRGPLDKKGHVTACAERYRGREAICSSTHAACSHTSGSGSSSARLSTSTSMELPMFSRKTMALSVNTRSFARFAGEPLLERDAELLLRHHEHLTCDLPCIVRREHLSRRELRYLQRLRELHVVRTDVLQGVPAILRSRRGPRRVQQLRFHERFDRS